MTVSLPGPLVSTDWLAAHLGEADLHVIDATFYLPHLKRDAHAEYRAAHVPGAVSFDIDAIADRTTSLPHMLPKPGGLRQRRERARHRRRRPPPMWPFWRALPRKGNVGIYFGSWYTHPIVARAEERMKRAEFAHSMERIRHFERMLVAEGVLLLKLWFHLSKDEQKKRLKKLSEDPLTAWRVTRQDWQRFAHYEDFIRVSAEALRETSTGEAPWQIIEGSDPRYRALTAGNLVLDALNGRLDGPAPVLSPAAPPPVPALDGRDLMNSLDYRRKLPEARYDKALEKAQGRLAMLTRSKRMAKRSLVLVFECMDAAGKGSTIRPSPGWHPRHVLPRPVPWYVPQPSVQARHGPP